MAQTYAVLAPIYETIGMADFARNITPRLIDYAQRNEWLGRRVIDLGCGTGASAAWLCNNRFTVTGVDNSRAMLDVLDEHLDEKARSLFKAVEQDVRELQNVDPAEMVLALGLMNEMDSLRDLEKIFKGALALLNANGFFVFDMYTIEGLTRLGQTGDQMIHDRSNQMVFTRDQYDYERQMQSRRFIVFRKAGEVWEQQQASRVLRAYPIQAVAALLQRSGFTIMNVFTTSFEVYEPGVSSAQRVIFVSQKQ